MDKGVFHVSFHFAVVLLRDEERGRCWELPSEEMMRDSGDMHYVPKVESIALINRLEYEVYSAIDGRKSDGTLPGDRNIFSPQLSTSNPKALFLQNCS